MIDSAKGSKPMFMRVLNQLRMLLVLIGLVAAFSILSPHFLNAGNFSAIGLTISVIGIVCIGQTLALLTGTFDLSVGSVAGFCGIVVAQLTKQYGMYPLVLLFGIGIGALIGHENPDARMQSCAFIVAPFRYRHRAMGAVGVVGPTRMEYERAITTVEYVANLSSRLLSSN